LLAIDVYRLFRSCNDCASKDQVQRAAISITNNIAEGFERRTNKELINFLYIAKGSCGEMRSMITIAVELGYLDRINAKMLWLKSEEISKIIYGLIRSLV